MNFVYTIFYVLYNIVCYQGVTVKATNKLMPLCTVVIFLLLLVGLSKFLKSWYEQLKKSTCTFLKNDINFFSVNGKGP